MSLSEKLSRAFRRKPMTDEERRARQEAKIVADQYRGLKSSQLTGVGENDAAARGGRGRY